MKTIGFIRDHEIKILDNVINYENQELIEITNELQLNKIIEYLESGNLIFTMTLALIDDEGKVIGPYEILTDGNWLWPRYYPYYLKSKKINTVNKEFFNQIKSTSFSTRKLSLEKKQEAKKYFWELLLSNNKNVQTKTHK